MALAGVKKASEELGKKKSGGSSSGAGKTWLKIEKGEEVTVRPLEQGDDFKSAFVHSIEVVRNGKKFYNDIVCLDQGGKGRVECPGCEERAKVVDPKNDRSYARKYKFYLNVIWRDGPIFEKDDEGKIVRDSNNKAKEAGRGDVIALWSGGIRAAEELDYADEKYKGLTKRDFTIKREGEGFDTKYKVSPALDENGDTIKAAPLTSADEKIAADRYELDGLITPGSYDDFFDDVDTPSAGGRSTEDAEPPKSPFRRNRG